jgi:hypothetical protein
MKQSERNTRTKEGLTLGIEEGSHGESAMVVEESSTARPGGGDFMRTGRWSGSGGFMRTGGGDLMCT